MFAVSPIFVCSDLSTPSHRGLTFYISCFFSSWFRVSLILCPSNVMPKSSVVYVAFVPGRIWVGLLSALSPVYHQFGRLDHKTRSPNYSDPKKKVKKNPQPYHFIWASLLPLSKFMTRRSGYKEISVGEATAILRIFFSCWPQRNFVFVPFIVHLLCHNLNAIQLWTVTKRYQL